MTIALLPCQCCLARLLLISPLAHVLGDRPRVDAVDHNVIPGVSAEPPLLQPGEGTQTHLRHGIGRHPASRPSLLLVSASSGRVHKVIHQLRQTGLC